MIVHYRFVDSCRAGAYADLIQVVSLTVIDYTSDHYVSDAIWIRSQKYVIESPLASQGRDEDFEN
jgi:hypothetical protein